MRKLGIFVIGPSGFKSVSSLKRYVETLPAGSELKWAPGRDRLGGEPLLSSEEETQAFRLTCGLTIGSSGRSSPCGLGPSLNRGVGRHRRNVVPLLTSFTKRASRLRADTFALYLAARHAKTPWYAKLFVAGVVAYALSPIDLIPDFIPVLGYLDDLILVPLGIAVAIKMIPPEVLSECRERAQASTAGGKPVSHIAAAVVIGIWLLVATLCLLWGYNMFTTNTDNLRKP